MKGSVKGDSAEQVVSQLVDIASGVVRGMSAEQRDSLATSLVLMALLEDVPKEALLKPISAVELCAQCGLFMGEEAKRRAKAEMDELTGVSEKQEGGEE